MGYGPGNVFYRTVNTQTLAGVLHDADSLPTARLRRNGADDANPDSAVTVVQVGTGDYVCSGTIPARYNLGDTVEIVVIATVLTAAGEFTRSLGKLDTTSVISLPVVPAVAAQIAASSTGGTEMSITIFEGTTGTFSWHIVDGAGNGVNLSGHTVELYIHQPNTATIVATVSGANVVLSRSDPSGHPTVYDTVSVTIMPAHTATAGSFEYKVRDVTASLIYGSGKFNIKPAP